ncbi:MAG: PilZ domain-containing protein [Lachnospiraceae bacterium]|nr:PilZ domain-containing protein [Lachnospiraceae bacterium]
MEEKRKGKRTDLDLTVTLGIITEDVGAEKEYIEVEITDVSKYGLAFKSDKRLLIGDCFDARIQIWTKEIIDSVLKVVRCQELEDEEGEYLYGCIFVGMTDADMLKIQIYQMFSEEDE